MEEYPTTRMSSTTPSKMTTPSTEKTINVSVAVRTYYEHEVDYDEFKTKWMTKKMKDETDEDYEKRTEKTWALLTERMGDTFDAEEVDEGDCFNDQNPLECYGDVKDEWVAEVRSVSKEVKKEMKASEKSKVDVYYEITVENWKHEGGEENWVEDFHSDASTTQEFRAMYEDQFPSAAERPAGRLTDEEVKELTARLRKAFPVPSKVPKRLAVGFTPYGEPIYQ